MEEKIIEMMESLKDRMTEGILEMVRIDSVESEAEPDAPFGPGVKRALLKALELGERLGFRCVNLDNYIGYAEYGRGPDYVCAMGHVDVVPVGDGWRQPPFSGYMADGVIYSRGILDNKGPLLSCLYGLYALKELGFEPKHRIRLIFGCDEESGLLSGAGEAACVGIYSGLQVSCGLRRAGQGRGPGQRMGAGTVF